MKSFQCSADKSLDLMRGEDTKERYNLVKEQEEWFLCFVDGLLSVLGELFEDRKETIEGFQVLKGIWVCRDTEQM